MVVIIIAFEEIDKVLFKGKLDKKGLWFLSWLLSRTPSVPKLLAIRALCLLLRVRMKARLAVFVDHQPPV